MNLQACSWNALGDMLRGGTTNAAQPAAGERRRRDVHAAWAVLCRQVTTMKPPAQAVVTARTNADGGGVVAACGGAQTRTCLLTANM